MLIRRLADKHPHLSTRTACFTGTLVQKTVFSNFISLHRLRIATKQLFLEP